MSNMLKVAGYENFRKALVTLTSSAQTQQINIYFAAKKNPKTGKSWCPNCNVAYPFVLTALNKYAPKDSIFLEVDVGRYPSWKKPDNPFRTDPDVPISLIPTLARWGSPLRLIEDDCSVPELLEKFFTSQ